MAKGAFATGAGLSTVGFGLLYYGQNYLIYPSAFPPGSRTDVPKPSDWGLDYEDLTLVTPDNVTLRNYLLLQRKHIPNATPMQTYPGETDADFAATRPTVIMFHGNGGNAGHRVPLARMFYIKLRCNVVMLSYRGYGHSDGSPSEKGLRIDAQTTLDYILHHDVLSRTPLILYGQSIGGAVAIDLASRNPTAIRALVLENTFLSLPRMVPHVLPALGPFSFLCHQKWDSASRLRRVPREAPVLMLSGLKDEVVPKEHMRELWAIAGRRGEPEQEAQREREKGAGKDDTCVQEGYWTEVAEFIKKLGR
ncbi:alpha/beta-hydrolase [Punctularia strigosozonata HHB-11173 SS5]|uniref:Alpha/beta-hydrolase n=1 Tax=Punctularia strigosozonata (strain HHB-11173) TaxID=741275 RepID=R7S5M8_PUNST|nr:alpha/beta-hydrolase [Punctularia strigosozonata HHB-11173 SS5]EIN04741.1 alpha/beta-hydrolase [Punctularia strigosozonata HHB-11173 SS5]